MSDEQREEHRPLTLLEARRGMLEKARAGFEERCPCCTRLVKLYKRKIHAEMVLWLITLNRLEKVTGEEYHTTVDILRLSPHLTAGGTNGTLLVHWGLIEKIPERNRGGAPAGSYRMTDKGREFLLHGLKVPEKAHFLCGECVGFSQQQTTAREAIGSRFNFDALMLA